MHFGPIPAEQTGFLNQITTHGLIAFGSAWLVLRRGWINTSQIIVCFFLTVHISLVAFGLNGQHVHFFYPVAMLMPLLLINGKRPWLRFILALFPVAALIVHQYHFKILGGESLFGPRPMIYSPEQVLPDLIGGQLILLLLAHLFIRGRDAAERRLEDEHRKSEQLLLNILPEDVAVELKEKGITEPRLYSSATVCFTDFKGFTQIAESLTPTELVGELDRCFSYFDGLMERYNLEKLKTIGDSYMFAGGIPAENRTHPVDCVLAALEIQAFMNQMKSIKESQGLPYWELRLGIHTGDLVAGVIGQRKFAYDVWSDTVNTASRCESSGIPGKVNISGNTYELVKDFFECEYRGAVPTKNKGNMDMYFVLGLKKDLHRPGEPRIPNEQFLENYRALKGEP